MWGGSPRCGKLPHKGLDERPVMEEEDGATGDTMSEGQGEADSVRQTGSEGSGPEAGRPQPHVYPRGADGVTLEEAFALALRGRLDEALALLASEETSGS